MPKPLSEEKLERLRELASRETFYLGEDITTKVLMDNNIFTLEDAYAKGMEDGESLLAKCILYFKETFWKDKVDKPFDLHHWK